MTTTATLTRYSIEESNEIYELYYGDKVGSKKEKHALAKKFGRDVKSLANKAMNEKLKRIKPAKVEVVHFEKPSPIKSSAVITLGNVKIEVPSNSIRINGTDFSW